MENMEVRSSFDSILITARGQNVSDIHLASGLPIMIRRYCRLEQTGSEVLSHTQLDWILKNGVPEEYLKIMQKTGDVEYVHSVAGFGRYRVTIMRHREGLSVNVHLVDMKVRTVQEAGMPPSSVALTQYRQGLVIIAGPSGCGKTSTLAVLIDQINQNSSSNIIMIERPIEMILPSRRSQIIQRELGLDTGSIEDALRAALREDPNVLVVSEMRDIDTFRLAITAAETGHLVFATMNARDSAQAITILVGSFPPNEQALIRDMVAEALRGVICQALIPRSDGRGAVAAFEVMLMNTAVSKLIKKDRTRELGNVIRMSKDKGMVLLDDAVQELVNQNIVSPEDAKIYSPASSLFARGAQA